MILRLPYRLVLELPLEFDVAFWRLQSLLRPTNDHRLIRVPHFQGQILSDGSFEIAWSSMYSRIGFPAFKGRIIQKEDKAILEAQLVLRYPLYVAFLLGSLITSLCVVLGDPNIPRSTLVVILATLLFIVTVSIVNLWLSTRKLRKLFTKKYDEDLV